MRHLLIAFSLVAMTFSAEAFAATVGKTAPVIEAKTATGDIFSLAEQKGKTVVLEWTNKGCPFVKKFYGADEMQRLQKEAAADDVVWVTVISSAPGKQGHMDAEAALAHAKEIGASPAHIILDEDGTVGKTYGAKTTPHMFVIDAQGTLQYAGAIDSNSSADPADIATADNYVVAALAALKKGEPIENSSTKPYGCSVKYDY